MLACGPGLHQKRLEHYKAYSRSEIVYNCRCTTVRLRCLLRSDPHMLHPLFLAHFPLLFRGCLRRFGTFADIYARLLGVTSGPRLRRCSLLSLMPIQLPKKLPLKKRGKCTTGSACSSAATNAASCLPPIMAHLPSSAHALPAKWRLTAAKRARLPICPTTKLRALACKKPQKLKMNQDAAVNG